MSMPPRMLYDRSLERRRYFASRGRRTMPAPPQVYTPRLRDEQVKALRVLKQIDGRPMTKLVQEALDRYLEPYGGVDGLLEASVAEPADRGETAPRPRADR